ncbi:DUF1450 domain-containing protein [Paenibacillus thalictri]|uniref:DUF1450 domain-containing protein n=2 Tax=Paenibacillus thalictri TaxID=2527873 RepID=A0A4Q9DNN7_9BACL|nr:DUF1450 domain-containing protein [Paenibacillus thalictri]
MRTIIIIFVGSLSSDIRKGVRGPVKIKYCCRNLKRGSKSVYKTMKDKFPEIKHKKRDCLGSCKACSKGCMVLLGKSEQLVFAPSAKKLVKELKNLIG